MKILYVCCGHGIVDIPGVIYSDKFVNRDITCDCLDIDYDSYDMILASPPCNYWSRANYRRDSSDYSLSTRSLLPFFIELCRTCSKPVIVENVRNDVLFSEFYRKPGVYHCKIGRHTFFSNKNISFLPIYYNFLINEYPHIKIANTYTKKRQGDIVVQRVFELFYRLICNHVIH